MSRVRPSTPVFAGLGLLALGLGAAGFHAALSAPGSTARQAESAALVKGARLTDLALFSEARYTRHPSMADLHTAFQDAPMSFEHFPAGVFAPLPARFGTGKLGFSEAEVAQ
ncbi:MAG: hypothetical protein KDK28_15015 [Maritimibacter sp.]|nr:hypothetical protein [Maritimibacter sp.]